MKPGDRIKRVYETTGVNSDYVDFMKVGNIYTVEKCLEGQIELIEKVDNSKKQIWTAAFFELVNNDLIKTDLI